MWLLLLHQTSPLSHTPWPASQGFVWCLPADLLGPICFHVPQLSLIPASTNSQPFLFTLCTFAHAGPSVWNTIIPFLSLENSCSVLS